MEKWDCTSAEAKTDQAYDQSNRPGNYNDMNAVRIEYWPWNCT